MLPIESDYRTQLIQEDRHREAARERQRLRLRRELNGHTKARSWKALDWMRLRNQPKPEPCIDC